MSEIITPKELKTTLDLLKIAIANHFGANIENIILYGSYARGDFREDSAVDIMILLKADPTLPDEDFVNNLSFDFMYHYGFFFSIMLQNVNLFNKVSGFYPFFGNIDREGVVL
ncbi:MAG: nucleotidyltransferase domain-containing protein [Ignavibacteriales bacterium]|nr:nucleotidyltransferase domain-containing protein [Ignavibacteriales bacterium]